MRGISLSVPKIDLGDIPPSLPFWRIIVDWAQHEPTHVAWIGPEAVASHFTFDNYGAEAEFDAGSGVGEPGHSVILDLGSLGRAIDTRALHVGKSMFWLGVVVGAVAAGGIPLFIAITRWMAGV